MLEANPVDVFFGANSVQSVLRFQNERRQDVQMAGSRNAMDFTYDVSFDAGWLIGAHVSAHTDGTMHVRKGAVEIGQGLNTKVALVVAMTLGLPVAHVWTEGGDTRMCSNSACTGGSGTSESCRNAAMQAALELKSRVQDKLDRGMSWVSAIQEAQNEGQSLQAEGWFDGCVLPVFVWLLLRIRGFCDIEF